MFILSRKHVGLFMYIHVCEQITWEPDNMFVQNDWISNSNEIWTRSSETHTEVCTKWCNRNDLITDLIVILWDFRFGIVLRVNPIRSRVPPDILPWSDIFPCDYECPSGSKIYSFSVRRHCEIRKKFSVSFTKKSIKYQQNNSVIRGKCA